MGHTSFRFDDDNKIKYTYSQNHHKRNGSWIHTTPYIAWKIIERTDLILDTHSTECTWWKNCCIDHLSRTKWLGILPTTFSKAFSCTTMFIEISQKFIPRVPTDNANSWQAITWSNVDPVQLCIYASPSLNESRRNNPQQDRMNSLENLTDD